MRRAPRAGARAWLVNLAQVWHWPPAEMWDMTLPELMHWHELAVERNPPGAT
ncbi:MAG: GpE family phage tail protein [Ottowia sp.]